MPSYRETFLKLLTVGLVALVLALPGRAAEADALTPSEAEAVIKVDLKQILDSGLFKKHLLDTVKQALQAGEGKKFMEATGLDPLKDLDSVALSVVGTTDPKVLIVVRGKFDQDKLNTAIETEAKKDNKVKISKEDGYTIFEAPNNPKPLFAIVTNKGALVMSTEKNTLLSAVKTAGPVRLNADLQAALGKIGGKQSLWLAAVVTDEIKKAMQQTPQGKQFADKLKTVTASVNLTDDAHVNVQINATDAKAAGELQMVVDGLKAFLGVFAAGDEKAAPIVKEIIENIKVGTNNTTVTIDLKMSEDLLNKIATLSKGGAGSK